MVTTLPATYFPAIVRRSKINLIIDTLRSHEPTSPLFPVWKIYEALYSAPFEILCPKYLCIFINFHWSTTIHFESSQQRWTVQLLHTAGFKAAGGPITVKTDSMEPGKRGMFALRVRELEGTKQNGNYKDLRQEYVNRFTNDGTWEV